MATTTESRPATQSAAGGYSRSAAGIGKRILTSTPFLQIMAGIVIVVVWQLSDQFGLLPRLLRAGPVEVFRFIGTSISNGELLPSLWSTVQATLIGFGLASVVGIAAGVTLALMPRFERIVAPYLNALNSMPRIALGPLLITFFGIGQTSKVALAFTLVVFILMLNAAAGIQSADKDVLDLMKAHGCTRLQLFRKVLMPVAMPSIFAGLRLGLIYALLGVITAEMIASRLGIGGLILLYSQTFEIAGVYAMLIVLAVVSVALNLVMVGIETKVFRWRPPEGSER